MIELYDVGRVILGPFDAGYRFIAEQGHRHIPDSAALGRITAFHRNRSIGLCQEDFDLLNKAWVEAIRNRELHVNPGELVYPDVKPRFEKVKARGDSVILHTSGSKELVELLVGDEYMYDSVLQGSETAIHCAVGKR